VVEATARATAELRGFAPEYISVVLVDDDRIQDLNRRFRHIDTPTDVISFEADEDEGESGGEIIISLETTERQAQAAEHPAEVELAWLVSHGVLHLSGMDDETEEDLEVMLELQRQALARVGLYTQP